MAITVEMVRSHQAILHDRLLVKLPDCLGGRGGECLGRCLRIPRFELMLI